MLGVNRNTIPVCAPNEWRTFISVLEDGPGREVAKVRADICTIQLTPHTFDFTNRFRSIHFRTCDIEIQLLPCGAFDRTGAQIYDCPFTWPLASNKQQAAASRPSSRIWAKLTSSWHFGGRQRDPQEAGTRSVRPSPRTSQQNRISKRHRVPSSTRRQQKSSPSMAFTVGDGRFSVRSSSAAHCQAAR